MPFFVALDDLSRFIQPFHFEKKHKFGNMVDLGLMLDKKDFTPNGYHVMRSSILGM